MIIPGVKRAMLELCIDDAAGLEAALAGGADRIELCSALVVGGLTPSPGLMRQAAKAGIAAMAMIRPRAGDFVYSQDDFEVMLEDIAAVRDFGLAGVVLGAARPDRTLDLDMLGRLRDAAGPLQCCLHRVFDLTPDPFAAIDQAVDLGFVRILTSGQKSSVPEGLDLLVKLRAYAGERISVMPGGGITLAIVGAIIRATGISEIHTSCSAFTEINDPDLVTFGFAISDRRKVVNPEAIGAMRRMLAVIAAPGPEEVAREGTAQNGAQIAEGAVK